MSNNPPFAVELPTTTVLNPNPHITLYFSGLILMAYNRDMQRMEAGVHSTAPNHRFKIIVKRISPAGTTISEIGSDSTTPATPIEFNVTSGGIPRVQFYQVNPFDKDDMSRYFGLDDFGLISIDDLRDFRWIIDFEGRDLHNIPLEITSNALTPRIHINDGIFHTARRTLRTFNRIKVKDGKVTEKIYFGGLAHVIGANVYNAGQPATLKISDELTLNLAPNANTYYKIAFVNEPIEDDPTHNDFKEYYRVIENVDEEDQFVMCAFDDENECLPLVEPDPPEKAQPQISKRKNGNDDASEDDECCDPPSGGSDRVPCASGFLGQSNGLP